MLIMLSAVLSCRSHPKYVLDRHITRYDMLKPNAQKIGLHRGEAFYLRADLAHLHTVRLAPPLHAYVKWHIIQHDAFQHTTFMLTRSHITGGVTTKKTPTGAVRGPVFASQPHHITPTTGLKALKGCTS